MKNLNQIVVVLLTLLTYPLQASELQPRQSYTARNIVIATGVTAAVVAAFSAGMKSMVNKRKKAALKQAVERMSTFGTPHKRAQIQIPPHTVINMFGWSESIDVRRHDTKECIIKAWITDTTDSSAQAYQWTNLVTDLELPNNSPSSDIGHVNVVLLSKPKDHNEQADAAAYRYAIRTSQLMPAGLHNPNLKINYVLEVPHTAVINCQHGGYVNLTDDKPQNTCVIL